MFCGESSHTLDKKHRVFVPKRFHTALDRDESCGAHFREEHQTPDGEARRNDADFSYVSAWEYQGVGQPSTLHKEDLEFEYVKPSQRSYK